jgi:hypothetical protein
VKSLLTNAFFIVFCRDNAETETEPAYSICTFRGTLCLCFIDVLFKCSVMKKPLDISLMSGKLLMNRDFIMLIAVRLNLKVAVLMLFRNIL